MSDDRWEDCAPEDVLDEAWRLLETSVGDRRHGFHTPVLATLGADGRPEARTVILRAADRAARTLRFHCDARSPKAAEIAAEPAATLLFYDREEKSQVRARVRAEIHGGDKVALAAWEATGLFGRRSYLQPEGPSAVSDAPTGGLPAGLQDREPEREESEAGFENFRAVVCVIESLDWLYLRHGGHRRARFAWPDARAAESEARVEWLVP